jgi:serine O-acetyltransferase
MSLDALALHRAAKELHRRGVPLLPRVLRKLIFYLHSSALPLEVEIGEGTQLGYGGLGVVIHPQAKIGENCLISQQVTIGGRSGMQGAPKIGNYVRIGAGAKILGPITIGDFASVGANAVVLKDVGPGRVVAGVPARELRRKRTSRRSIGPALKVVSPGARSAPS